MTDLFVASLNSILASYRTSVDARTGHPLSLGATIMKQQMASFVLTAIE